MGNSFPLNRYINVGTNASIQFRKDQDHFYGEEGKVENWMLSYCVGSSKNVQLLLKKSYGKDGGMKLLQFHFNVPNLATFVIGKAKKKDLLNQIDDFGKSCGTSFFNEITNHWGGITKTNVIYHGSQNTGNLIVVEQKTKRGFEKPFVVTVAHYYAYIKNNFISPKKYEVGLSMEVDIRVLNNDLDVSIKGPSEHLSLELLQMFKEVTRTEIWAWTMRPYETHSRQYNTDHDEDEQEVATETENDDEDIKYLQLPRQIGGSIIHNQVIKGNNNGNLFAKNIIFWYGSSEGNKERRREKERGGKRF